MSLSVFFPVNTEDNPENIDAVDGFCGGEVELKGDKFG